MTMTPILYWIRVRIAFKFFHGWVGSGAKGQNRRKTCYRNGIKTGSQSTAMCVDIIFFSFYLRLYLILLKINEKENKKAILVIKKHYSSLVLVGNWGLRLSNQHRRRHRTTTLSMAAEGETRSESLVLSGMHDHYGGVIVHINDNDPMDPATFLSLLTSSIAHWKLEVID